MWTLRRTSLLLRACSVNAGVVCTRYVHSVRPCNYVEADRTSLEFHLVKKIQSTGDNFLSVSSRGSGFASQAGAQSSGEEDEFCEIDTAVHASSNRNVDYENGDDTISEGDLSDEGVHESPEIEQGVAETVVDPTEKKSRKRGASALFNAIIADQNVPIHSVLDKWVANGKDPEMSEIWLAMLNLRKCRLYKKALELFEWLEKTKRLDFVEKDHASRLDLIAKVSGLQKAEKYMEKIPESFRGEYIYRTLLANCASATNIKKAEEVFNKMRDLDFPLTSFACNQLLLLYKRVDKKKIADILLLMEKENIKPTLLTYRILTDIKGQANDLVGMEQIFETMKAEGVKPDLDTLSILARHFISNHQREKAESILKEMEGDDLKENRLACSFVLPLYAELGKADEVTRVWKVCEKRPTIYECVSAIEASGKLKRIDEAEAVFDRMSKTWKKLNSRHYLSLLKVYTENKMLTKGKDLFRRMTESGCRIDALTLDALVKLYVETGEPEKAYSVLLKAAKQPQLKPLYSSFMCIMDEFAKRGDVHGAEKIFLRMRQAGYVSRMRQYESLIQAYMNAKAPAYGIRERMKADNIFPNKALAAQVAQVDAFRRTKISDLLE